MKLIRIENLKTYQFTFKFIPNLEWDKIAKCENGLIIKGNKLTAIYTDKQPQAPLLRCLGGIES